MAKTEIVKKYVDFFQIKKLKKFYIFFQLLSKTQNS